MEKYIKIMYKNHDYRRSVKLRRVRTDRHDFGILTWNHVKTKNFKERQRFFLFLVTIDVYGLENRKIEVCRVSGGGGTHGGLGGPMGGGGTHGGWGDPWGVGGPMGGWGPPGASSFINCS